MQRPYQLTQVNSFLLLFLLFYIFFFSFLFKCSYQGKSVYEISWSTIFRSGVREFITQTSPTLQPCVLLQSEIIVSFMLLMLLFSNKRMFYSNTFSQICFQDGTAKSSFMYTVQKEKERSSSMTVFNQNIKFLLVINDIC